MKLMTIVGTRPELIKLALVIRELDKDFEHILVHTGQNYDYELNEIFFKDLDIRKPDHFLACAGSSPIETISSVLVKTDEILRKEKPDAVLYYGDTNSCLGVLSAKKLKIPIFHMEAGNRCFDQRVPEEINRKIVDHLSDVNLPLTEHGRRYLLAEGLPPDRVIKSGSCMFEILKEFKPKIEKSNILNILGLEKNKYFVVSTHREENVDNKENLMALIESVNTLAELYQLPIIFSLHPRTKARMEAMGNEIKLNSLVKSSKPFGFFDYIKLQNESKVVISDSGTLMEESAILGFPAVHCRESYERPEGMEHGVFVLTGLSKSQMLDAVKMACRHDRRGQVCEVEDYKIDNVSRNISRIIFSYTDLINRVVWNK